VRGVIISRESLSPIDFGGLRIFDYTAGYDLSSSLAVIEVPAGARHMESWSECSDKYYLVTAGVIQFELEGHTSCLGVGDFCLVRRGRRFAYFNPSSGPATLVLAHTPNFDLAAEKFAEPRHCP
jgi:mannose-6-phosphate isomerase-like protein (cupin superfamily)